MPRFENTCDWEFLARHFGLEVSDEEIGEVIKSLDDHDLWTNGDNLFDFIEDHGEHAKFYDTYQPPQWDENEVRRAILVEKLRGFYFEEVIMPDEPNQQVIRETREFVSKHIKESMAVGSLVFKGILQIKDDGEFIWCLQKHLEDLWW